MQITKEEAEFIAAYRLADDRAKHDAKRLLERNKQQITTVSNILSVAAVLGKSVDELFTEWEEKSLLPVQ